RQQIHPALGCLNVPVVPCDGFSAVRREMPKAATIQLAAGNSFQYRRPLDPHRFHVKRQPVWKLALPRTTANASYSVIVPVTQFDDALDALPPGWPEFRVVDFVPNRFERRFDSPDGNKLVVLQGSLRWQIIKTHRV